MNKIDRIKKIEEELKQLKLEVEEENQIDFSKFIGRYNSILAIKGYKYLKSCNTGVLNYSNDIKGYYTDKVNYEIVNMSDLKPNDVFILDSIEDFELGNFDVFVGKDLSNYYISQYLSKDEGIEIIENSHYHKDYKVKRFLRE